MARRQGVHVWCGRGALAATLLAGGALVALTLAAVVPPTGVLSVALASVRPAGSTGAARPNAPIVGLAATPDGLGYCFVAGDGGVFNYGDAKFYGSEGGQALAAPVVGMAAG
jgi:hypothetical protein